MRNDGTRIVKLKAGLGNQMFQYAFAKLLETKYGFTNVLLDVSYFDDKEFQKYLRQGIELLQTKYVRASKKDLHRLHVPYNAFKPHHFMHRAVVAFHALFNRHYYFEKNRQFVEIGPILHYSFFDGYWQSWRYLEPIESILRKDFKPKYGLSGLSKDAILRFGSLNSVFVGIRRGDYSASKKSIRMFGLPSFDYYRNAIQILLRKVSDPYFVVFSDDIEWVKKNVDFVGFGLNENQIEFREPTKITNNFEELFVMSSCKHAIISNSTFNFWGAWLIENPDKVVVAPKDWFKDGKQIDIIPPQWMQI